MNKTLLSHYLQFGPYTNPGLYKETLRKDLPNDIRRIGLLVRKQLIHRGTLAGGNTGYNFDLRYGDMRKMPWFRQCEDDLFPTAAGMLVELYRRNPKGFILDREEKDCLVVTCRFVSILIASILKSKGIPCRVRSGFAVYFKETKGKSTDHWINQYWDKKEKRWVTIDVDGCLEDLKFDPFDMPKGIFDFSAESWLAIRRGKTPASYFHDTVGFEGLITVGWELFHDFHSLMNNEIIYQHGPAYAWNRMNKLTDEELKEIDELAELMVDPDKNFIQLKTLWQMKKKFRILKGSLL